MQEGDLTLILMEYNESLYHARSNTRCFLGLPTTLKEKLFFVAFGTMNTIEQTYGVHGLKVERTFRTTILYTLSLYASIKSCVDTNKKKVFQLSLLQLSANTK